MSGNHQTSSDVLPYLGSWWMKFLAASRGRPSTSFETHSSWVGLSGSEPRLLGCRCTAKVFLLDFVLDFQSSTKWNLGFQAVVAQSPPRHSTWSTHRSRIKAGWLFPELGREVQTAWESHPASRFETQIPAGSKSSQRISFRFPRSTD